MQSIMFHSPNFSGRTVRTAAPSRQRTRVIATPIATGVGPFSVEVAR